MISTDLEYKVVKSEFKSPQIVFNVAHASLGIDHMAVLLVWLTDMYRNVKYHPGLPGCVCVQNRGKWDPFWLKVREWRVPLNGCQISQAPLYGYTFAIFDQKQRRAICSFNV